VPNLVLQPLVENAIRHGIEPRSQGGRIELRCRRENGRLVLEVRDNGVGLSPNGKLEEGVGLSNTRARLEQLYGEKHSFAFGEAPGGGLAVRLELPFRALKDTQTLRSATGAATKVVARASRP